MAQSSSPRAGVLVSTWAMAPKAYPVPCGPSPWDFVRLVLALLASAAVAAAGAAILGEYQFTGLTGAAAGLIFGIFVAEAGVAVNRGGNDLLAGGCALLTAAALLWGVHASFGARSRIPPDVPTLGWGSVGAGGVGAGGRA